MRKNLYVLRYEDFALNPEHYTNDVYRKDVYVSIEWYLKAFDRLQWSRTILLFISILESIAA